MRNLLAKLPDGVYISATGKVFKIEEGKVTKLVEKERNDPSTSLVGGHDDPKSL